MAQKEHCSTNNYNNNNAANNDKKYIGRDKILPTTSHEDTEGKHKYRLLLHFFNFGSQRRGWVVNDTPRPLCPRKRSQIPILQEVGWAPETVWTNTKNLVDTGLRTLGRTHQS